MEPRGNQTTTKNLWFLEHSQRVSLPALAEVRYELLSELAVYSTFFGDTQCTTDGKHSITIPLASQKIAKNTSAPYDNLFQSAWIRPGTGNKLVSNHSSKSWNGKKIYNFFLF